MMPKLESFSPLLLLALLLSHSGCSQKPAQEQTKLTHNQPVPDWVKECSASPDKWYCGSGSSNAEAIGEMVNQIVVSVTSEYSQEIERNLIQQVEAEIKKTEIINQKDVQKVEASSSNIEVSGTRFYQHPNGTFYAAVKREDLVSHYSYKIKELFGYAQTELERAKAEAKRGDNKAALAKANAVRDTLGNNADSWALILHIAGGSSSDVRSKKGDYLLQADSLRNHLQAKGFVEQLKLVADSLEFASNSTIVTKHPKNKNEAWQKSQQLWSQLSQLQERVKDIDAAQASSFDSMGKIYEKARSNYLEYCKTVKFYWNPKLENLYSKNAFALLSAKLKMDSGTCKGNGISLIYKSSEPVCAYKFGLHTCSDKPSLSIASCGGTEYLLLENSVDGAHQREDFALERVQTRLRTADFWDKWVQEIQLWRPLCE